MRHALLFAVCYLLSLSSLSAQCAPTDFIFSSGIQAPRFGNAPISWRDQPLSTPSPFLPSDGIDVGEYGLIVDVSATMEIEIMSGGTPLTLRPEGQANVLEGPASTLNIFGTQLSASGEYEVYLEPGNCDDLPIADGNGNNGITITCNNCPVLPANPDIAIAYIYDSLTPNVLPVVPFSNVGGNGIGPDLNASALEKAAWKSQNNPLGNQRFLSTVYRSNLIQANTSFNQTELIVDISEIEYNTTTYEQQGLAEGWGVSLVARNVNSGNYSVIQAEYRKGFQPAPSTMQFILDPSVRNMDEELFVSIWRVRSVRNVNGLALGDFLYPSNYALFDFQLRTPIPLPPPPPHNTCGTAKPITYQPGSSCTLPDEVNTFAATSSPESSSCFSTDVWLSFTATSTQYDFLAEREGSARPNIALYEGACDNLNLLQCGFTQSNRDTFSFIDLTIGADYLIRLSGSFATTGIANNAYIPDPVENTFRYCLFGEPETCTTPEASLGERTCLDFQQYEFELTISDLGNQPSLDVVLQNTGEVLRTVTATGTYVIGPVTGNLSIRLQGNNATCFGDLIALNQFCGGEANDECSGAFFVPLSDPSSPILRQAWGRNATASSPALPSDCGAHAGARDFWFSVVNTTGAVADIAIVTAEINDTWSEHTSYFYTGDCQNLAYERCDAGDLNIFTDVAAGDTIFVRSAKTSITNNNVFSGTSVYAYPLAPLPNDDCNGATPVGISTDLVCTTSFAGDNTTSPDGQLWYSFQPGTSRATFLLNSIATTIGEANVISYELYSGTCGNLSLVESGTAAAGFGRQFNGLTAGDNYLLALQTNPSGGRGTFDACLLTPPPAATNNTPDDAIVVPVNTDGSCDQTTAGTTFGATAFFFSCAGGSRDDDVFFKFTANATAYAVELSNVNLLVGNDPTTVIQVGRFDQFGGFSTAVCGQGTAVVASGLTVGEEYFISVYTVGAAEAVDFDLCLKTLPTPVNDLCENALPLTPNTDQTCSIQTSGTLAGADGEGFTGFFCGNSTPVDDVWYTFQATANVAYSLEVSDPGFAQRIQVYVGSCGSLTSIYCDNNQNYTLPAAQLDRQIYVRVFTFEFTADKTFDLCLQQLSGGAPDNENCEQAISVPVSTPDNCSQVPGTTFLADKDFPACFGGDDQADVYFEFVATETAHLVLIQDVEDVLGLGFASLGIEVFSGTCGNLTSVSCNQSFENSPASVVSGLTVGETYIVRVFEHSGTAAATFNICVQTIVPPANDEEAGAIPLLQELIYRPRPFTLEFATSSGPAVECNGNTGTANDDVWFSFVANTTDPEVAFMNNFFNPLGVEVYAPGASDPLACYDPFTNFTSQLPLSGLTIGDTYRIRVYSYNSGSLTGEGAQGEIGVYGMPTEEVYLTAEDFCTPLNTVTSTGSGQWLYLRAAGDFVAAVLDEEPMGDISTGVYGHTGGIRTDANGIPYLDRNLQIGVSQQPSQGSVQVALFFTLDELDDLGDFSNSIISLFNVRVSKFSVDACGPTLPGGTGQFITPLYSSFIGSNGGLMVVIEIDDFSSFFLHAGDQPLSSNVLPVSCTEFAVSSSSDGLSFRWATAAEDNHAYWHIEGSADGLRWDNLLSIGGDPVNRSGSIYQRAYTGNNYKKFSFFRLVAEANDGTIEQACDIQEIDVDGARPILQSVYPNPVSRLGELTAVITLPEAAQGALTIYDLSGKSVLQKTIAGTTGINQLTVSPQRQLAPGIYQLQLVIDGQSFARRIIITQ